MFFLIVVFLYQLSSALAYPFYQIFIGKTAQDLLIEMIAGIGN
jgi:hypothetical protein